MQHRLLVAQLLYCNTMQCSNDKFDIIRNTEWMEFACQCVWIYFFVFLCWLDRTLCTINNSVQYTHCGENWWKQNMFETKKRTVLKALLHIYARQQGWSGVWVSFTKFVCVCVFVLFCLYAHFVHTYLPFVVPTCINKCSYNAHAYRWQNKARMGTIMTGVLHRTIYPTSSNNFFQFLCCFYFSSSLASQYTNIAIDSE